MAYQFLQQLVPVNAADQAAGVVVVCDIGGVLGEDVAHDLVDGVVTLFPESVIHRGEDALHLFVRVIRDGKFSCSVKQVGALLLWVCIKSHVRELEGILIKMISISEISGKPIDHSLADYVLKSYLPKTGIVKITSDKIMEKVSLFYNITVADLTGKVRTSNVAVPRQVAMYLCHKLTDMNFTVIGKAFGNKDRTTVMHNVRKIESDLETNESLKSDIDYIMKDLQSQL